MAGEVELRGPQHVGVVRRLLGQPFEVPRKDRFRRAGVARTAGRLGQRRAVARELVDIGLQKESVRAVERVQVAVEHGSGQLAIEGMVGELGVLEQPRREARDVGVGRARIGGGERSGKLPPKADRRKNHSERKRRQRRNQLLFLLHVEHRRRKRDQRSPRNVLLYTSGQAAVFLVAHNFAQIFADEIAELKDGSAKLCRREQRYAHLATIDRLGPRSRACGARRFARAETLATGAAGEKTALVLPGRELLG